MELNQLAWGELDQPDTRAVAEKQKLAYEENYDFLATFDTPSGKKVLEWLIKHTLETPTWWPDADYNKSVANGFWREGQNSLVRQIKAKIQLAKDYQKDER